LKPTHKIGTVKNVQPGLLRLRYPDLDKNGGKKGYLGGADQSKLGLGGRTGDTSNTTAKK